MRGILKNPRHEHFAQLVASGVNQAEAARTAGFSEHTAKEQGSRLLTRPDVKARVEELRPRFAERVAATTSLTQAYVLEKLHENMKRAMQLEPVYDSTGKPTGEYRYEGSIANRALELIGKELGMFVDQKKVQFGRLAEATPEQLLELLAEIDIALKRNAPVGITGVN